MAENTNINPNNLEKFRDWWRKREERKEKKRADRKELRLKWETLTPAKLCSELDRKQIDYDWHVESHPEGMDGAQRVDVVGEAKSRDHFVFIEIERGKAHAIDNVVKVWRYIEEHSDSKPVRLVQIFSPYFYAKTGNKRRMKEAIFIGKQAEKATSKFKYEWLGQEYWPPSKDSKLDALLDKISSSIAHVRNNK